MKKAALLSGDSLVDKRVTEGVQGMNIDEALTKILYAAFSGGKEDAYMLEYDE